uniref:(northern house mosquito) hypothetical protein n=1 Tax=Culex pipiens TaxID=7175 RepID=A0A8D8IMK7_CULPI
MWPLITILENGLPLIVEFPFIPHRETPRGLHEANARRGATLFVLLVEAQPLEQTFAVVCAAPSAHHELLDGHDLTAVRYVGCVQEAPEPERDQKEQTGREQEQLLAPEKHQNSRVHGC